MKKNIPSLTVLFKMSLFCIYSYFKWFLLMEEHGQKHLETTGLHTTTSSQSVLKSAREVFSGWPAACPGVLYWQLPPGQGDPAGVRRLSAGQAAGCGGERAGLGQGLEFQA